LNLEPQSIYTITTTSGQGKAKDPTMAASKPFPLPYSDSFNEYAQEATVKYFSDQGGSWTARPDPINPSNMVFTQVVTIQPILWHWCSSSIDPLTLIGYNKYNDYSLSVDALLTEVKQGVYVAVSGRIGPDSFDARRYGFPPGYTFQVESTGNWWLWRGTQSSGSTQLGKGLLSFSINKWHNLEINFKGNNITAHFDGEQIWTGLDQSYSQGLAALGSGLHYAYFDNFKINGL
jgi:galactosylceramidase